MSDELDEIFNRNKGLQEGGFVEGKPEALVYDNYPQPKSIKELIDAGRPPTKGMVIRPKDGRKKVNEGILISDSYDYIINGASINDYMVKCQIKFEPNAFVRVYLELEFSRGDIRIEGLPPGEHTFRIQDSDEQ